MRLRKVVNRVYGGTVYYRWVVSVPPRDVQQLGWVNGQELETMVRGSTLVVQPSLRPREGRSASTASGLEGTVTRRTPAR